MGKTFFIIDGSSCIYRAFHAITGLATSKGLPTNATYGFIQTLRKILKTYEPDYMAIAFDVKGRLSGTNSFLITRSRGRPCRMS